MDADLESALPLALWAVVVDDFADVVAEATFCGLVLLLLLLHAQEEAHGDVGDCEGYSGRLDDCHRLSWGGCGALPLFYFLFVFCFGEKLG